VPDGKIADEGSPGSTDDFTPFINAMTEEPDGI
jgi:hypothetical protein